MGAGKIYAIDPIADRRARAAKAGANSLSPETARETIREETRGRMVDGIVEAVGSDATIGLALRLAGPRGTVSCLGFNQSGDFPFPMAQAFINGLTFRTGKAVMGAYTEEILNLLQSGRIHPETTITHRMTLSEGAEAYHRFENKEDGAVKIVLTP
jgi:threonine dehydrogenase-like Zn-dependent dehydrogenase